MSQIKNLKKVLKKNEQTFLSVSRIFFHYIFYTINALKCLKKVYSKKVKKTLKKVENGRKTGENGRKNASKKRPKKASEKYLFSTISLPTEGVTIISSIMCFLPKISPLP